MDLPISAFTGMVGLHYGRKKRKGKVGAHLPLEPWAQAQPDADAADSDADAGDAMAEEEEAGSGEEKKEERKQEGEITKQVAKKAGGEECKRKE